MARILAVDVANAIAAMPAATVPWTLAGARVTRVTLMTARSERVVFYAAVAATWLVFEVQALHSSVLLDDWVQLAWHHHNAFGLSSIVRYWHTNYLHTNPRIGDVFLMLVDGPRVIHLIATPLVQLGMLWLAFAVPFGRWPRATLADLQLLLLVQVLIWLVVPFPGVVYFYRPFATNYLWGFAITLALCICYRFALAGDHADAPRRIWAVPLMLALGWVAGMCNEHTGPAAMIAVAWFVVVAYRKRRLRAWMVAGVIGLFVGYAMLYFAPGQALRYEGKHFHIGPLELLRDRGITGCWAIVADFIGESQVALDCTVVVLLLAARRLRGRGETLPALANRELYVILGLVAAAAVIVFTQFASPAIGDRLFFAPGVLVAGALALVIVPTFGDPLCRRLVVACCGVVFVHHMVMFVWTSWQGYVENQDRIAQLAAGVSEGEAVVTIAPYKHYRRTRWWKGEDFQDQPWLHPFVALSVFDLRDIDFAQRPHWAEPIPKYVATGAFEPPPSAGPGDRLEQDDVPLWSWALLRFVSALAVPGHRLARYEIDLANAPLEDPQHRPTRLLSWRPGALTMIESHTYDASPTVPFICVAPQSVPPGATEAYVIGCGQTRRVTPTLDATHGLVFPIDLQCRGAYSAFMCDPQTCWVAGKYWR
jgi:hypothetical protein